MAVITYPVLVIVDDAGAIVNGATIGIASVVDKAGVAIASHGATLNTAGPCVSVDYDAEAHGEGWVTLAIGKVGSTITGLNAAPSYYLSRDSSRILLNLAYPVQPGGVQSIVGTVLASPTPTANDFTVSGLPDHAVSGDYNGNAVLFQGSMGNCSRYIQTHTRIGSGSGATDRLQFASGSGFARAPAGGNLLKFF